MQQKFITSHSFRVQRAKELLKKSPERISIWDREAYVEFYLLEDIVRLYEYRLEQEKKKHVETHAGAKAKALNIEKFSSILNIFKSATEIAWGEITSGNYSIVWKSIHEHALMMAAGSVKNLPQLKQLAIQLLRDLSDEAINATSENVNFNEELDDLNSHEENVRKVKGVPSSDEIDALIKAVEVAIPDVENNKNQTKKPIIE